MLTEDFSKSLHKRMFGEVWKWAGVYRQNEFNIGIEPHLVTAEVPALFDNARFWVENKTFPPDEIDVDIENVRTFFLLRFRQTYKPVPILSVKQITHLLRT